MKTIKKIFLNSLFFILVILSDCYKSEAQEPVKFLEKNYWGLKNSAGEVILKPTYTEIGYFSHGLAQVEFWDINTSLKHGLIDITGKIVAPLIYQDPIDFAEDLAMVSIRNKENEMHYGYIDRTGKVVIPIKYSLAKSFANGYASVTINNNYGFIDKTGKVIIPIIYCNTGEFSEGLFSVAECTKNTIKFGFGSVLLPKYGTPTNPSDGYCSFILPTNVTPNYYTSQSGTSVFFEVSCDNSLLYNIRIGVVLKYKGLYVLNLPDGITLEPCANETNPYPRSGLQFFYNLADCNSDVYLSIPLASRKEFPVGFTEGQILYKVAFALQVQ